MSLANIFLYGSLPLLAVYFFLFNNTMNMLDDSERKRFVKEAGSKSSFFIAAALFFTLVYVDDFWIILIATILISVSLIVLTHFHHKKIKSLNFDRHFEKRLWRISFLAAIAILLVLVSSMLETNIPNKLQFSGF